MALKNIEVRKNGVDVGTAEAINLIEGTNVTITATNDYTANDELDVTISATGGGGSGHTVKEDGAALTQRTGLNFTTGLDVADDVINDETDVSVDTSELAVGGELSGTVASATVAATHSGSAHHAQAHSGADHTDPAAPVVQAFGDVAAAGTGTLPPANEDHKHGMPADPVTAHAAAADPHTGYRLESADHTHATTGLQAGTIDHGALTGLIDDDHTQYMQEALFDVKGDLLVATAADTPARLAVGTNDQVLMADSAQATGLKWVSPATPVTTQFANSAGTADTFTRGDHVHEAIFPQPLKTGHWYSPTPGNNASTQQAEAVLDLQPFWISQSVTLTGIACEVSVAGDTTAVARLGIYEDDGTGYPGALLLDAGTVDTTSTGTKSIVISQAVTPGLYWLGLAPQGIAVTRASFRSNSGTRMIGITNTNTNGASILTAFRNSLVIGALPNPFSATVALSGAAPYAFIKV
jgi:hypothetical protein